MRSRARRGAVLPLVALLIVGLAFCAAFVVDFSRAYAQKNELQTAADAGALAGVLELFIDTATVADSARSYSAKNLVLTRSLPAGNSDVVCGYWDDDAGTFAPGAVCSSHDNAVSFTIRDTVNWVFPLLTAVAPKQIHTKAIAWYAYIDASSCIKPWAMPYWLLTTTLDPSNPDTLRDLNEYDMQQLQTLPRAQRRFKLKLGSPPSDPGNFGTLNIPDSTFNGGGGSLYRNNIASCNPMSIGRGTVLYTQPGNMAGPTIQGARDLCEPLTPNNGGECQNGEGQMGKQVVAALWSSMEAQQNGTSRVMIQQLVSFSLDSVTADAEIIGAFLPVRVGGTISTIASTLQRPVLVK